MASTVFSLATLITPEDEKPALVVNDETFRLDKLVTPAGLRSVRGMLDDWEASFERLVPLAERCAREGKDCAAFVPAGQVALATPIKFPNKLLAVGANYKGHLIEMKLPAERWKSMPFFMRAPTVSLVGPGKTVRIPKTTRQFDWEIELAVVVGKRLKDASPAQAAAAVAGYSIGIDLSCRDLIDRTSPVGVDLMRVKCQDGMAPCGPVLMPSAFVGDPQKLMLSLYVNGERKQHDSTSDMLYTVAEQLSTISDYLTLEPGDIIFTGSPAGAGAATGQFLKPGDRIRAEIERVGRLDLEVMG